MSRLPQPGRKATAYSGLRVTPSDPIGLGRAIYRPKHLCRDMGALRVGLPPLDIAMFVHGEKVFAHAPLNAIYGIPRRVLGGPRGGFTNGERKEVYPEVTVLVIDSDGFPRVHWYKNVSLFARIPRGKLYESKPLSVIP